MLRVDRSDREAKVFTRGYERQPSIWVRAARWDGVRTMVGTLATRMCTHRKRTIPLQLSESTLRQSARRRVLCRNPVLDSTCRHYSSWSSFATFFSWVTSSGTRACPPLTRTHRWLLPCVRRHHVRVNPAPARARQAPRPAPPRRHHIDQLYALGVSCTTIYHVLAKHAEPVAARRTKPSPTM